MRCCPLLWTLYLLAWFLNDCAACACWHDLCMYRGGLRAVVRYSGKDIWAKAKIWVDRIVKREYTSGMRSRFNGSRFNGSTAPRGARKGAAMGILSGKGSLTATELARRFGGDETTVDVEIGEPGGWGWADAVLASRLPRGGNPYECEAFDSIRDQWAPACDAVERGDAGADEQLANLLDIFSHQTWTGLWVCDNPDGECQQSKGMQAGEKFEPKECA